MSAVTSAPASNEDLQFEADLMAMVEEIGTAVAAGLVPILGQAINVYDTIESLLALHKSEGEEALAEAKFDLILALVGWIPGAGGGVKKTIRIVNKNPERYAPILFDVLRMVCTKIGIQTSPETLLDQLFNAAGLTAVLGSAQTSIEQSWAYEQMPAQGQQALSSTMTMVRASLPAMLMLVTVKLTRWKRLQRNTAARSTGTQKKNAGALKPKATDPEVAKSGANAPHQVSGNSSGNASIGTLAITEITNELTGTLGEHITDYFLYEEYGWGKGWSGHDQGVDGSWTNTPDRVSPGKLNERSKLNPLFPAKAHGVGIDGVWKVDLRDPHNSGKRYAIVESKASSKETLPKNPSKRPSIASKLLTNARSFKNRKKKAQALAEAAAETMPKIADLLDPPTDHIGEITGNQPNVANSTRKQSPRGARHQHTRQQSAETTPTTPVTEPEEIIVQMSRAWIRKNIRRAVDELIAVDILENAQKVYSRHLFYTPAYLQTAIEHLGAMKSSSNSSSELNKTHENHSIPANHRYDEKDVSEAVNKKLKRLQLPSED